MVPVTVLTLRVVAEQQVGAFLTEQGGQLARRLVQVSASEPDLAGRIGVEHRAVPAVRVAQVHDPGHAEPGRADPQFGQPGFRVGAEAAAAGHDHDRAMSLGRQPGERAAGQQHLVIRVGVERDDGGHPGHPGRCRSGQGAFV